MISLDDDLLAALRAARPVPETEPAASSPEARAMLARILGSGRAPGEPGQSRQPGRPRRSRRLLIALPAGAAAAAAAVVLGISLVAPASRNAPVNSHQGRSRTLAATPAMRLLASVAQVAARQPAPRVKDSQFVYVATMVADGTGAPHLRQTWLSVSNLCDTGLLKEPALGVSEPLPGGAKCPDRGSLGNPTYRLLASLPTDPHALLNMIYAHIHTRAGGQSADYQAFDAIGTLLRETIAPPRVSAALYQAAALIPGVTKVADVADATGRRGVAVEFRYTRPGGECIFQNAPGHPLPPRSKIAARCAAQIAKEHARPVTETIQWIFDKTTLRMIGEIDSNPGAYTKHYETAVIQRAVVDSAGDMPPGH
jgi:hypothetical protein